MLLTLLSISWHLHAQTPYAVSEAELTVSGTSTLHNWTMTTQSAQGEAMIRLENRDLECIQQLVVTVRSETLKSGKSGMDNNAYKALKTKKNPEISFKLKQIKSIEKQADYLQVQATGILEVAGSAQPITLIAQAFPTTEAIRFTGEKTLSMTDFEVEPPSFMMGTIKTGNEITLHFDITFNAK